LIAISNLQFEGASYVKPFLSFDLNPPAFNNDDRETRENAPVTLAGLVPY
jgi:hypothetical protein